MIETPKFDLDLENKTKKALNYFSNLLACTLLHVHTKRYFMLLFVH
jgi:hypothetical protein